MPSVTLVLSHAPQLTIALAPYFTVTLGPYLLLAALLYDVALIALVVGVLRHLRARRRSGSTTRLPYAPLDRGSSRVLPGITVVTLPRL